MWSHSIASCRAVIMSYTMSSFAQRQPHPDQKAGFEALEMERNAQFSCLQGHTLRKPRSTLKALRDAYTCMRRTLRI